VKRIDLRHLRQLFRIASVVRERVVRLGNTISERRVLVSEPVET